MDNSHKFKMKRQSYSIYFILPVMYMTFIISGISKLSAAYEVNDYSEIRFYYIYILIFLLAIIVHLYTGFKEKNKIRYLEIALGNDYIDIGKKRIEFKNILELKIPKYDPFIIFALANKKSYKIYLDLYEQPEEIKAFFNNLQLDLTKTTGS